jgi:pimeloyl-ACP methyl ester carboxylesterase
VVAQVPTINGYEQARRRTPPDDMAAVEEAFSADERAQLHGEPPRRQAIVSTDPTVPAAYRTADAVGFYLQPLPDGTWENSITVRSTRAARMYEPGTWIARVSPTPLLMIVATHDTVTPTDLALDAYQRAHPPKQLSLIPGGHFEPYLSQFPQASSGAVAWFQHHLIDTPAR